MKSTLTKFWACLILAGVINVAVIEPALCFQHDEAVSHQQESAPCCEVCHPALHQGILPTDLRPHFTMNGFIDFVQFPQFALSDSPAHAIFHPPSRF